MNRLSLLSIAVLVLGAVPAVHSQALPSTAPARRLTYQQAGEEGVKRNLDLLAASYGVPLAQADELTAGLWNNPTLLLDTVFEPFGRNWNQASAGGPRQFDAIFGYPFDLSGKIPAARRSARAATGAAEALFQDAVRRKLLDIRLSYIEVLIDRRQLDLAREKQASLQRLVDVVEGRIGGGGRLPLLRLRAQLARDQADLDLQQREVSLRAAQAALAANLGRSPEESVDAASGLREFVLAAPPPLGELVAAALKNRPDLLALRLYAEKSKLDRAAAIAQKWGDFDVTAGFSAQGPVSAPPAGGAALPRADSWNAGVTIPLPLFNRNQGNIRKAALTGEQARAQLASLELAARQELAGLSDRLKLDRGLIVEYESRQLANARKVRDEQQRLVGVGYSSLLDYFDAVAAYSAAVSSYYDVVGDYRRDAARLDAACAQEVLP